MAAGILSPMSETVCYLRKGRKLRATGEVIWRDDAQRTAKVKPARADWGAILITADEIEAGKEKPAYVPRSKPEGEEKPTRKPRAPKPPPVPRWKELVERVRLYEIDHVPDGWPGVQMKFLTELADELEAAQSLFQSKP